MILSPLTFLFKKWMRRIVDNSKEAAYASCKSWITSNIDIFVRTCIEREYIINVHCAMYFRSRSLDNNLPRAPHTSWTVSLFACHISYGPVTMKKWFQLELAKLIDCVLIERRRPSENTLTIFYCTCTISFKQTPTKNWTHFDHFHKNLCCFQCS